jgi:hypothetical protein
VNAPAPSDLSLYARGDEYQTMQEINSKLEPMNTKKALPLTYLSAARSLFLSLSVGFIRPGRFYNLN